MRTSTAAAFWSRIDIGTPEACWPWRDGYVYREYGLLSFTALAGNNRPLRAHAVAWALTKGDGHLAPRGFVIHHLCGNKLCCNPAHLEAVTHSSHAHIHNGVGCAKHGTAELNEMRKCRACDRERKKRYRADPEIGARMRAADALRKRRLHEDSKT